MKIFGYLMLGLLILSVLLCAAFGLEWAGIKWYGFFGPKYAAVEREVFKQTRQFTEGKIQELGKQRLEYFREKDEISKKAILSTIRHNFSDFDRSSLKNPELELFLRQVMDGQNPTPPL